MPEHWSFSLGATLRNNLFVAILFWVGGEKGYARRGSHQMYFGAPLLSLENALDNITYIYASLKFSHLLHTHEKSL